MIINPKTGALINGFVNRPSGSLLVVGSEDAETMEIITNLARRLLSTENQHNIIEVYPEEGKGLSIEQARELRKSLINTVVSKSGVARVAIVWQADTAAKEAQNTLLKLIEEPLSKTLIILQATDRNRLLPTINSRCQLIPILPITRQQAVKFSNSSGKSPEEMQKAFLVSQGESKLYQELLINTNTTFNESVSAARQFLQDSVFDRLSYQKQYDKPDKLQKLIADIERLASAALHASSKNTSPRWGALLRETRTCSSLLEQNVTAKIVFLRLCVQL